jgi:hypothetical protein
VFGVFGAVSNAANLAGYLAGGLLLPVLAPRTIMAGTGVAGLIVAVAFLVGQLPGRRGDAGRTGQPRPVGCGTGELASEV